jgi:GntR family transcriptional regulator, vanillate catabolism transcriptional regulator
MARSHADRAAQRSGLLTAGHGAFALVQASLPESRKILVLAQDQHHTILEAIENREGTRAENMAREHARIPRRNLEIALERLELLGDVPGASLLRLC